MPVRAGYVMADEVTLARQKSFTSKAVAALVIYCFLWLPGLIANILFLNEAKAAQKVAGTSLPGTGCLSALLWTQVALFGLVALIVVMILAA